MFLERALKVDDEYVRLLDKKYTDEEWDEYGEFEQDQVTDTLLDYQEIVTRSVLGELNALVEYELKWIAKGIRRKRYGTSLGAEKKISREKACESIEAEFGIKLKDLPGALEVDEIRKVVNAYKHDDGYSGKYDQFFAGAREEKYEIDPDIAGRYLAAVREFLASLPGKTLNLGEDIRIKH